MPQIFHRSMNTISKVSIFGGVFIVAFCAWLALEYNRSSNITHVGEAVAQPVPFSHQHHVAGLGIDCRYCHTSVENSAFANVPPTSTCMNCHQQIWFGSQMLEPVRASYKDDKPIEWNRVHELAGYVYFNHSIHVNKGVGCSTCHGRVDQMQLTAKAQPMTMEWCLQCHRNPAPNLRPKDQIFNMAWEAPKDQEAKGAELAKQYKVRASKNLTSCSVCHR